jgi:Flp pilus assembly protein TadG
MFTFMRHRLPAFRGSRNGNVSMMFALSLPVLIFGVGFAVDFTNATIVKSKLNSAADAAALAALTPAMMQQSQDTARAAAIAMFTAQASSISTLASVPTPTVTFPATTGTTRKVLVTYSVQNKTFFGDILAAVTGGTKQINIQGSSTAQATIPPNINFYLLLDNSPSMALPASSAGITQMQNLTSLQGGGCAFACHQASTNNADSAGNLCTTGGANPVYSSPTSSSNQYCAAKNSKGQALTQLDNYAMARYNNIELRLDELSAGVTAMMQTAQSAQNSGLYATPPAYQFAAYAMNSSWQTGMASYTSPGSSSALLMAMTSSYQSAWSSASSNFGVMEMYSNNNSCGSVACTSACNSSSCGPYGYGDVGTNYDNALSTINSIMPTPGNGTNVAGDKPQEVLFFVTDGVEDETNINRLIQPVNGNSGTNYCTTIKNRGIKIAILYTQYLPVPSNAFYQSSVAPIIDNVPTALQACASPGFFIAATYDTNLGTALSQLFTLVVQQATLIN